MDRGREEDSWIIVMDDLRFTNNWFDYQAFYTRMAREPFSVYVEVGVWKGHSISFLANLLRDRTVKIYAVDLFERSYQLPEYQAEVDMISTIYNANLKESNTRHLITDIQEYSDKAASHFEDGSVDFVFIDADHACEAVKKDIAAWLPKVRRGGIIAGHDYHAVDAPGVVRAVTEEFDGDIERQGTVWSHRV